MNKQDSNGVRTAQDIERKYDFAKMLVVSKNFEISEKNIVQIQNALNEMLNALVINLKDVLESQGDVSLWFYSGIPTGTNAPYTSWSNPADHYGDLYYDTDAGKVYEFYELEEYTSGTYVYGKHGMWDVNSNPDLLRAMAITNSEIDTSTDHERKIFFQTPTTPYSSGDWWVKTDGTLFICQLGKSSGTFDEKDFIDSSSYSPTIAESFDDVIQVLKGTVTQLSEDCVRFTDLSTGGSTTIAGENIKTGNIESNNYVQNTSGMKINLSQGTIDTKNFKTDVQGNIYLGSGAKVIGGDGLLTNLQFLSGNEKHLGINWVYSGSEIGYQAEPLKLSVTIPSGFTIVKSILTIVHIPVKWYDTFSSTPRWGYARNIGVFKQNLDNIFSLKWASDGAYVTEPTYTQFTRIFNGSNTWTPSVPSDSNHPIQVVTTSDLNLQSGFNKIIIKTTTVPTGTTTDYAAATQVCEVQSGLACAILDVYGYTSY